MAKLSEEEKVRRAMNRRRHAAVLAEEVDARQTRERREWVVNGTYLSREELELGSSVVAAASRSSTGLAGGRRS